MSRPREEVVFGLGIKRMSTCLRGGSRMSKHHVNHQDEIREQEDGRRCETLHF